MNGETIKISTRGYFSERNLTRTWRPIKSISFRD